MTRKAKPLLLAGIAILAIQGVASYAARRDPFLPLPPPFSIFPFRIENWTAVRDLPIDPAALEMLGPDDTLHREYQTQGGGSASLFVAYYKTQLRAKQAHDPKVCLPGSGWNPVASRLVNIPVGATRNSIPANYYRISKQGEDAVVIYWFQTHKDVYTFEQQLRAHRLLDAIVDNRTDMALVRLIVPVGPDGVAAADARGFELAKGVYPLMLSYFP